MGETADDIKRDVEQARARLGQDLNELEYRVRSQFDWRVQLQRHPWVFVGAAFAVAVLVGAATKRSKKQARAIGGPRLWLDLRDAAECAPRAALRSRAPAFR